MNKVILLVLLCLLIPSAIAFKGVIINADGFITNGNFTALLDTPNTYSGANDNCVIVNETSGRLYFGSCASAGSGDITAVLTSSTPYLLGGQSSGSVSLDFNETLLNATIDARSGGSGDNSSWNQALADTLYLLLDGTNTMSGDLDMGTNNIIDLADVTFQTGASGGTLRTGTSNADKFILQGYDVNDGAYVNVLEVDAGNDVLVLLSNATTIDGEKISNWLYNQTSPAISYADATFAPNTTAAIEALGFVTGAGGNSSFNQSLTDTLYADIIWGYNQSDGDTTYDNGTGLSLSSTTFSILTPFQLPQSCNDGEIAEYNTTSGGWDCAIDNSAASGMSNWVLAADDTGGSESITDGETVTFNDDNQYLTATRSTNSIIYTLIESVLNATIDNRISLNPEGFLTAITNIFDQSLNTTDDVVFNSVSANDWSNITITESQISDLSHTIIWDAAFNASFDDRDQTGSGGNSTFNQSLTDTLYAGIEWDYNQTTPAQDYADTTFGTFNYNMTDGFEADTNANTLCAGTTTYLDGEGNCDDISTVYEGVLSNEAGLYAALSDVTEFVETNDAATLTTLDTGQGANELYDMDQNVLTTSDVQYASINVTNNITVNDRVCLNSDCSSYIWNNGTDSIWR